MWRCEDVEMSRCEDEKMWRWADVKMWGCEDVKMWAWEDVKMSRCEDVKMSRCEVEKMRRWEDVRMRRCEDEQMWRRCEDEQMWRCEDEQMWRWEDVKMSRCEDVKMSRCEDEKMRRWEDVRMRRCEDEKMFYRPPLVEEPCAQTLSGKTKQFCQTSSFFKVDNIKNEAILRDGLHISTWQRQKRSNSARLPHFSKLTTSKTKEFCETSFKNGKLRAKLTASYQCVLRFFQSICLNYCAYHEKAMPGHTKCCTCHAKSSQQTWRFDAPKCNPSQEITARTS